MAGPPVEISLWRSNVHELVAECAEQWRLRLGEPYTPGAVGHVLRAELPDGTPAVLKVSWPHREEEQEVDALERWDGDGAVRLYARDDERHALLLERCEPGTFLSHERDALGVLIELLPRLWKSGEGFRPLAEGADFWLENELPEVPDLRFRVTAEPGLDRERARGWTIAQTVAWSGGGDSIETLETARWLLEDA